MDQQALAAQFEALVPFTRHVGVQVTDIGEGHGATRLPDAVQLTNHLGTQHAAALFTAGELASGVAVMGAFLPDAARLTMVVRSADVRYLKPARGPVEARAHIVEPLSAIRARLDSDRRVDFEVAVELQAGDVKVAELAVRWHLRVVAQ